MGLSAFSRARVSQLPELELEAERFEKWNKTHQESFRALDELHSGEGTDEKVQAVREAMGRAVITIGEKVVAGLQENTKEGDPVDLPLRLDHVRDLVGRRSVEDPQGEPKTTLERLHERIPTEAPASETIVYKTDVASDGPTREEMEAAYEEQAPWTPEGEEPPPSEMPPEHSPEQEAQLPAPGHGAGVMPGSAVPGENVVPPTTQVEPPKA
jgi:hypothetical protein